MWHERRDLVFTDIFVRSLSERRATLRLLPLNRSPRLSSLVCGGQKGVPHSSLFCFFCTLFIVLVFIIPKSYQQVSNPFGELHLEKFFIA